MRACTALFLLSLLVEQAHASCQMPRPRLVCAEYFHSKAVVIARLAGVTPVKNAYDDVIGTYYSMTVEQPFRGKVARLFRVYESVEIGHAKFDWKTGDSYLLFLREESPNGSWVIDVCGNSGPYELTETVLQQVEAIDPTSNHALIQGLVWDTSSPGPVAGVQIEARGPGGINTSETKADGRFEMRVAPGKYQLRATSPERTFVADKLSYENPDDLVLENGGCAQVQFVESNHKQ